MLTAEEMREYLAEIREEVCKHCVERPPEGPPCYPHGKVCGVELHLPQLIEAIQDVQSGSILPYLEHDREVVCEQCAFHGASCCPCPMDELIYLIVNAVETVAERRKERGPMQPFVGDTSVDTPEIEDLERLYAEATGRWTGCDWTTSFGPRKLDLCGMTAAAARARAPKGTDPIWDEAATWLTRVEGFAREAERNAAAALVAVRDGNWPAAAQYADKAWALEFCTGRMIRQEKATWRPLHQALQAALWNHGVGAVVS